MRTYTLYNATYAVMAAVVVALLARNIREAALSVRIGIVLTLFAFPWDYFAIRMGAWGHADPGPRAYGVPVNDLIFIFLSSALAAAAFLRLRTRGRTRADGQPNTEDPTDQGP